MSMDRKENMLAILTHQPHDHIGNFQTDIFPCGGSRETFEFGPVGGGVDSFGVSWLPSESAMGEGVPVGKPVLADICDWEDIVTFPDIDAYDWAEEAAIQRENYDPKTQILEYGMWNGPFLRLVYLMGFENGLCSMLLEPEACRALLEAITDYKIKLVERIVEHFHPDAICTFDDVATERSLFMAPEVYREFIKPMHIRINEAIINKGVIPTTHICGKCEDIVPDLVDEKSAAWEICQPENDLIRLQAEVGDKLAFLGCYDSKGPFAYRDVSEEELRASARETIDKYGPGGNLAIAGMILYSDRRRFIRTGAILSDEIVKYGTNFYRR